MSGLAKALIVLGLSLAALGAVLLFLGKIPLLGRLPGDVVVKRPGFTLYLPLGTSLLLSAILSLLLWLWKR